MIKRKNAVYIRRGHRIWFYDIVQGSTATSIMTTSLRRRRRPNTKKYWSHSGDNPNQDMSLTRIPGPTQPSDIIYPSLSYQRLSLRKSKASRQRPRKVSSPSPTRLPNDVLAAYKASCMRKTRRPSPLNVGELQVTSTHVHFTAHYLNCAPSDANVSLPFRDIIHIRRACYRRLLPHGVLIRCEGLPDYLMVLADREQQADVLEVIGNAMRNTPTTRSPVPATSERMFLYDSASSDDICSPEEPRLERERLLSGIGEDSSSRGSSQPNSDLKDDGSRSHRNEIGPSQEQPNEYPNTGRVNVQPFKMSVEATEAESKEELRSSSKGSDGFRNFASNLLSRYACRDDFMEALILLTSAVLLLIVTLSVVLAISSLGARIGRLSSIILQDGL